MSFWSEFLGLETRSAEEPLPGVIPPPRELSSRAVSTDDALSLSAVYRAMSIYTTAVKQISIDVYRGDDKADTAPLFIRQPNADISRSAFLEQTQNALLTTGNCYWRVDRDSSGRTTNLTVLNPHDVEPKADAYGNVTAYSYRGRDLATREVQHLAIMRLPGRLKGLGPIQAAQTELRGALDTQQYGSNWFQDSGLPAGGYWSTKEQLNPQNAAAAREALKKATSDREGTAFVGNGLELHPFALSPEDAQWLEAQRFSITQVARLFGVPSSLMLAALDGAPQSYQNVSQEMTAWARFALMQYLTEIEDAFTQLLPRGQKAVMNIEALLRADTRSRYEAHEIALRAGFYTVDEVRAIEGLPPLPEPEPAPVEPAPETIPEAADDAA